MTTTIYHIILFSILGFACTDIPTEKLQNEVSLAFRYRNFGAYDRAHFGTGKIVLQVENEYNDVKPVKTYNFNNLSELNAWLLKRYPRVALLIIPKVSNCDKKGCRYKLPKNTLHHGSYFMGFDIITRDKCPILTRIYLYET